MDQRKAQLASEIIPALVPLFQVGTKMYLEEKQLQKQTQARKEIIEAKSEAETQNRHRQRPSPTPSATPTAGSPSPSPDPEPEDYTEKLESMAAEETCGTCAAALRALKDKPPEVQERGIDEYDDLKRVMERADGPSEITEWLEDSDVLGDAIRSSV